MEDYVAIVLIFSHTLKLAARVMPGGKDDACEKSGIVLQTEH
jgi:hypothetical protein